MLFLEDPGGGEGAVADDGLAVFLNDHMVPGVQSDVRSVDFPSGVFVFGTKSDHIHTGTMYVLLSIALNVSRRQGIAPVPLGTEALSSSLKAPVICVGGLMLFLISMGCS